LNESLFCKIYIWLLDPKCISALECFRKNQICPGVFHKYKDFENKWYRLSSEQFTFKQHGTCRSLLHPRRHI